MESDRREAVKRALLLPAVLLAIGLAARVAADDPEVRATMHELFAQIRIVLPLALDDETFASPDHRERISAALETFRARARTLAVHGREKDAGFAFQSDSLAAHAETIARSYARGETRGARYLLHRSLDDCVACHSKLPTANEFPLGQLLLAEVDLASLSARERARIQVVSRQFEAALGSYEDLFAQPNAFASRLVSSEDLLSYLKISLTIENDAERAVETLKRLGKRADLPGWLARDSAVWIASIERLRNDPLQNEPLPRARALLKVAETLSPGPSSRGGLIYRIEAWHELQRFVAAPDGASAERAEAYYLLGKLESVMTPYRSSAAAPYLEAAIRTQPHESWGRDAFDLLERLTILGYTGSGGTRVPPDVQAELDALKKILGRPASP